MREKSSYRQTKTRRSFSSFYRRITEAREQLSFAFIPLLPDFRAVRKTKNGSDLQKVLVSTGANTVPCRTYNWQKKRKFLTRFKVDNKKRKDDTFQTFPRIFQPRLDDNINCSSELSFDRGYRPITDQSRRSINFDLITRAIKLQPLF